MKAKHVLGILLVFMLCAALVDARNEELGHAGRWWTILSSLAFSFLSFFWYRLDSDQRQYPRTMPLNVGVVALGLFVIPYYLVRSRPAGQRGRALLRLAGFVLLMFVVSMIGMALYDLVA
jgi:hypothetical protein